MQEEPQCNAEKSLILCSLFESEILVWLILRNWGHPLAENGEYRTAILETATEVLYTAAQHDANQVFIEGMPSRDMNLIAALWYAENRALEERDSVLDEEFNARLQWMDNIRRSLPSCFCPADDLPAGNFHQ